MTISLVQAEPSLTFPETLEALAPPPLLLPGESLKRYQILRHAILAELAPQSAIEWLLAIDIVELSWEIQRYRLLRHRLLEKSRQRAIADALNLVDVMGIAEDARDDARRYTELNVHAWRYDKEAAIEIEGRLASFGHDDSSLDSDVLVHARELYIVFEGLIISAQHRRTMLLREIEGRRRRIRGCARNTSQKYSATGS